MAASKQYRWGKTSGGVLLFLMGGCFLLASGCATPQEIFTRKWEKYRDGRDDDDKKVADASAKKVPPKDFPRSQKKRSWFHWGSDSPKVATEKATDDAKKADPNSTDKLAKQLAQSNKSAPAKSNANAKPTDPRLADAKNALNSVQPRNAATPPNAKPKSSLDVKDPFLEELENRPAARDLARSDPKAGPAAGQAAAKPAADLDAPWATHNANDPADAKLAGKAKAGKAAAPASTVDMTGLSEEEAARITRLKDLLHLSDEEVAQAVQSARAAHDETPAAEKHPASELASTHEAAEPPASDPLEENPFARMDRERELADAHPNVAEKPNASSIDEPRGAPIEDENRVEADTLMFRARMALKRNRREDALRLAEAAQEIERTAHIQYSPNEERPSDLVKRLKGGAPSEESITMASAAVAADRRPENRFTVEDDVSSQSILHGTSLEHARRNVVAELPPERSSVSSSDFLSGGWRDVTAESPASAPAAENRIEMAHVDRSERERDHWRAELNPVVASNRSMSVPSMATGEGAHAEAAAGNAPAWAQESANAAVAPAPPPPDACEEPDAGDEVAEEPVGREMFDIPEDKPQSAEYPLPLVLGFGLGMAGICGFGFWRRMQSQRFAPRS